MFRGRRRRKLARATVALCAATCLFAAAFVLAARTDALGKARGWLVERVFGEVKAAGATNAPIDPELFNVEVTRHGRIIQVRGQTSPGATVMINSYGVAFVDQNGRFIYYLDQWEPGEQRITITAQTPNGGVATFQQLMTIE